MVKTSDQPGTEDETIRPEVEDSGRGTIVFRPHRDCVAARLHNDARVKRITTVLGLNHSGRSPAGLDYELVRPNIVDRSVGLRPHSDRVPSRIRSYTREPNVARVCFNQTRRSPTRAGNEAVRPGAVDRAIGLRPHCDCVSSGIQSDRWGARVTRIVLNERGRPPSGARDETVRPIVVARAVILDEYSDPVAARVHCDSRRFGVTGSALN